MINGNIIATFENPAIIQIVTKIKKPIIAPRKKRYIRCVIPRWVCAGVLCPEDFASPGISAFLLNSLCFFIVSDI